MPWRENKGVANLDGFRFFSSCARNLWGKSVLKNGRGPEMINLFHYNL